LYRELDDHGFHMLLFGPRPPAEAVPKLDGLMQALEIPDDPGNTRELARTHIPAPSFCLLRPDGHVGLCGTRFEISALERYLADRIGFSASRRRR
jgi:hypothetical protein